MASRSATRWSWLTITGVRSASWRMLIALVSSVA